MGQVQSPSHSLLLTEQDLSCVMVSIKNVILYMGVTYKEMKWPLQQQVGTQGLSLSALSSFLQTVLPALRQGGVVIYTHNKTPPECSWSPTFEQH